MKLEFQYSVCLCEVANQNLKFSLEDSHLSKAIYMKEKEGGGCMVFRPELDCGAQAEYFSATINREVRKVQKVAAREQN